MNGRNPSTFRGAITALLFAAGIATTIATGGGGGSGSPPPPPPPPPPSMLAITSDNAEDVSTTLVLGLGMSFDIGDITGSGVTGQAAAVAPDLLRLMRIDDLASKPLPKNSSKLDSCLNGGTLDVTATLADPNTLTVGDRIVALFTDCDDGDGYVISGTVDLTVSAYDGDFMTEVYLLGFDVLMTDVVITEGTDSVTVQGDYFLTLDSMNFPVISQTIGGFALELASGPEVLLFESFNHFLQADFGVMPEQYLATVTGDLDSQLLGGSVHYETPVDIELVGDNEPYTGEILVTGASNSSVRIVINDSTSVTLEVDTNGDGTVDEFIDTTWAALNGNTSTINASTAPVVATEVIHAVVGYGSLAVSPGSQFQPTGVFGLVRQQAVQGTFGPVVVNCQAAGTASVSGTVATAGAFAAGDLVAADFNGCARSGEELNGTAEMAIASFDELPGDAYLATGTVTETGFQRIAGGLTYTGTGVSNSSYDFRYTSQGFTYLSASTTTFTVGHDGIDRVVTGASVDAEIILGPPPVTIVRNSSGNLSSPAIEGNFNYVSITPDSFLFDADPATGPYSGELRVTASDGSTVTIVAIDEQNVRLDVDSDGDTFPETSIDTTWAALQ